MAFESTDRVPTLTIAVPTFNRRDCLRETLTPLIQSGILSQDVQLCVYDNSSDDGTSDWLKSLDSTPGCRVVRQRVNIGLEGNILDAMLRSSGDYVWTVSDHMALRTDAIARFIDALPKLQASGVDIIYAGIESFGSARSSDGRNAPVQWRLLSAAEQSRFIFRTGNISGMVTSRRLRVASARSLYRFSGFSYPHLAVYAHIDGSTFVAETESLSDFLVTSAAQMKAPGYNSFRSRFIGYPTAVRELRRLNTHIIANNDGLLLAVGALRRDVCDLLQSNVPPSRYPLMVPLRTFPWRAMPFIVFAMAMQALPSQVRSVLCQWWFHTGGGQRAADSGASSRYDLRIIE